MKLAAFLLRTVQLPSQMGKCKCLHVDERGVFEEKVCLLIGMWKGNGR